MIIPTPDIGQPVIPTPETPRMIIPTPDIGQPVIPTPETPRISIATPDIGQPVIPMPEIPSMDIPAPIIPQPTIPTPNVPSMPPIPQLPIPEPNVSPFKKGLEEIQAGLDKIGENNALTTLATQLSVMSMAIGPIQQSMNRMLEQPSRLAGAFDSSMKNIQAITGNTQKEMAVLNRQLLDIGKNAVAGPQGVVDAMNDIAGGVDNAASHLGILNGAVLLAEAGQADLGVAANGLVSIMNAYSLASGDAASATANAVKVSDVLTQTVGQGVGSMEAFIGAFSQVSGLSASVGVGFDEVGSALAFITTQGPSAAEAATQLKAAETSLLNPNKTLAEALQGIGIASGSAMLAEYGLVESLNIVKQSVGGSQDMMAKALGSTEALNGATALLGSGYTDFATKFGSALASSVTAEAAAVQSQSYESKLARMEAATQALQLQIGDNVNAIKGRFMELGTGFLVNVVSPIMASPIGGVFQNVAAVVGVTGQGLLSFGASALTTATQFTTLAANIKNAEGYAKIFHGTMTIMQAPFRLVGSGIAGFGKSLIGVLPAVGAWIASGWAATTAWIAATWPILAVVAAVGLVAFGVYQIIKNWDSVSAFFVGLWNKITGVFSAAFDWIRNTLAGMSDWVLVGVAVFMPFIGIPALIIKHWDTIAAFFVGLWTRITGWVVSAWEGIKTFFASLWTSIVTTFTEVWNAIPGFFTSLWNGIASIVTMVANWFSGVWQAVVNGFSTAWTWASNVFTALWDGIVGVVTGVANWFNETFSGVATAFAAVWTWVSDLFTSIFEGIKGVVLGFVEWLSPVIDMIIAPFKAIGNVIGGIIGSVKGWLGETVEIGKTELAVTANENKMRDAAAKPVQTATPALVAQTATLESAAQTAAPPLTATSVVSTPTLTAAAAQVPSTASTTALAASTTPASSSGSSLAMEHLAAAQRKGVSAADMSYAASSAFENAGAYTPPAPIIAMQSSMVSNAFPESLRAIPTAVQPTSLVPPQDPAESINRQLELLTPITNRETVIQQTASDVTSKTGQQTIHIDIDKLYLQAEDCEDLFDFARMILQYAHTQKEALV
jgi:TP901 family phage tail tape measure protein